MPSYCLYARFPKYITHLINTNVQHLHQKFKDKLLHPVTEDAHITIVYGPSCENEEITLASQASEVYGQEFIDKFGGYLPFIYYRGVSHFQREHMWIIKLEFESSMLTQMRTHVTNEYDEIKQRDLTSNGLIIDTSDHSYSPNPTRWIHSTLLILKLDTSTLDILQIEEYIRELFLDMPSVIEANSIVCMSAITDTPIKLW